MSVDVTEIVTPELVSETKVTGDRIAVSLVGSAEGAARDELATHLASLHRAALHANVREIVVDVAAVEFVSAASLRALLAWIAEVRSTRRYVVRFAHDEKRPWQRRSLEAIAAYGGEQVRIS